MANRLNGATVPTILVTAILVLFGLYYNIAGQVVRASECTSKVAERVSAVEATNEQLQPRLDRMESKIDRLLELRAGE